MSSRSEDHAVSHKRKYVGVLVVTNVLIITVLSRFLNSSVFSRMSTDRTTNRSVQAPMLFCPELSPHLQGPVSVNKTALSWSDLPSSLPPLSPGGRHTVTECRSRHHVAIVIPYRDRDEHLRLFLRHMIPLFLKQQLDFGIYVVDQRPGSTFNRGMLMNIGFVEALKVANYSCFVFSDIDLLLENDKNVYGCPATPRHLSVAIDRLRYRLPYGTIFGGVENFRTEHFRRINGFSNKYFGWGGEDDDLYRRVLKKGLTLSRPNATVGRYTMFVHRRLAGNPDGFALLKNATARQDKDGLNSLLYNVVSRRINSLYTNITVMIDQKYILEH